MSTDAGNLHARVLYRRVPITAPAATARAGSQAEATIEASTITFGRSSVSVHPRAGATGTTFDNSYVPGQGVVRWVLLNERTGENWTVYLNPNEMAAFPASRSIVRGITTRGADRMASFETPVGTQDWSFSGVLLAERHYRELERWAALPGITRIRDHIGRYIQVILTEFVPTQKAGRGSDDWKMKYTMNAKFLRRVK